MGHQTVSPFPIVFLAWRSLGAWTERQKALSWATGAAELAKGALGTQVRRALRASAWECTLQAEVSSPTQRLSVLESA